jgi:pimeloyl-ACP methyl ester carboxylesterase
VLDDSLYRAGEGEPLVLLHGFTGTWHHWRPLLGDLVARHEVIAPTLSGHAGGPPFPLDGPLTMAAATDSLVEHLDEIGIDSAHFVGNSMGGALALELAKRGRARSVVALAPGGGWTEGDGEAKRLARFFTRQIRITRAAAPRIAYVMRRPARRRLALRDVMRHGELVAPSDAIDMARRSLRCSGRCDQRAASGPRYRARGPGPDRVPRAARLAAVRPHPAPGQPRAATAARDPRRRVTRAPRLRARADVG